MSPARAKKNILGTGAPRLLVIATGAFQAAHGGQMIRKELSQKRRQVGGAHRSVLRATPVEPAVQLVQLPVDSNLITMHAFRRKTDRLTPARPGICDVNIHYEV